MRLGTSSVAVYKMLLVSHTETFGLCSVNVPMLVEREAYPNKSFALFHRFL